MEHLIFGGLGLIILTLFSHLLPGRVDTTGNMDPKTATQNDKVLVQLEKICYIHHRMYTANSVSEPQTFFEYLDLDITEPPFDSQLWFDAEGDLFGEAQDLIHRQYLKRRQRLINLLPGYTGNDETLLVKEGILARVARALEEAETAATYVKLVMPRIQDTRGEQRLDELKSLCGDRWRNMYD